LHATGLDKLTSEQLRRLHSLLRQETGKAVAAETERRDRIELETAVMALVGKPIKRRLVGSVSGREPSTVFELENGQRWKVLKGHMKLRQPLQSPRILLVNGIAGRWFLQARVDFPKALVYRIDCGSPIHALARRTGMLPGRIGQGLTARRGMCCLYRDPASGSQA
jgi:hypothetical protein